MDTAPLRTEPLLSMTSPLGKDVLVPSALDLREALSEPFLCTLDMVSTRSSIDPDDLLHHPVCVAIGRPEPERHLHGLVRRFVATGPVGRSLFGYRADIVPALWFLSQTQDCRIWENKSAKDILQTVFSDHELTASFRVADTSKRPFTVQYNETDLTFVTRIMQEEGWFYWFTHDAGQHTLIVADTTASFTRITGGPFRTGAVAANDTLSAWQPARAVTHGKIMMADYNPEEPRAAPQGETPTTLATAGRDLRDPFHWPAGASTGDAIARITRRRMQAAEVAAALAQGSGGNPAFMPGTRIDVMDTPNGEAHPFLLASVSHKVTDNTWRNGANPSSCTNSFTAFPGTLPWRPEQTVPRPRMEGVYSATVIGPPNQDIHTDKLGRVKIRFQWDRRRDATAGGAIWVRVMQPWAGNHMGWSFIPRVGSEVAVTFMDGNPDRPVVVGQLHNGDAPPPWPLPDQKTRSGLRTRSTQDGGSDDYSELSFDDSKGAEQVFLHAQRDLKTEVEHDATHQIGHDRGVTIQQGNDTLTVQQGNIAIKAALGAISIEAMQSITLKVGQSSITLDPAGVTIKGMTVTVQGQMMTSVKAPIVQLDADGMLTAAGGIIMLN